MNTDDAVVRRDVASFYSLERCASLVEDDLRAVIELKLEFVYETVVPHVAFYPLNWPVLDQDSGQSFPAWMLGVEQGRHDSIIEHQLDG